MKILVEKEAEELLEKEGFNVAEREFVKNKSDLRKALEKLDFPVVMKVSSKRIVHKAKVGGIITNVKNLQEAGNAFDRLSKIRDFEEVLVQKMLSGKEMILGLEKTDEFGLAILIGAGGSRVEEKKDISFRICPIDEKDAEEMIKEIKFYKELEKDMISITILKNNLLKLSQLAEKYPDIKELDINPLMINGQEAVVADARIVFEFKTNLFSRILQQI